MITPYHDSRQKREQVREMFDNIAPAYDGMNLAMTLGLDKKWRKLTARSVQGCDRILDLATGTGDLAILLAKSNPNCQVTGLDLSERMVTIGKEKVAKSGLNSKVHLNTGDCLALPFGDETFAGITCAFGVRNFQDLLRGYQEMFRVLEPGGRVAILELSSPTRSYIKPFYHFYTRCVIPFVGRVASHDRRAYSYLPESIAAVPQGQEMLELMSQAGFEQCKARAMTWGVCSLYTATKLPS